MVSLLHHLTLTVAHPVSPHLALLPALKQSKLAANDVSNIMLLKGREYTLQAVEHLYDPRSEDSHLESYQ